MYDLLILNGKVIDGCGNPWFRGDLAIVKDKIVKIGNLKEAQAAQIVNAGGDFITPGFIDGHSHSDLHIIAHPRAEQKVMQGITTENLGLDGMSAAPISEENIAKWRKYLSGLAGNPDIAWNWSSFSDYLDRIDAVRPSVNITSYVGLGTIRLHVMGMDDRKAVPGEIECMKRVAAQAMEDGARGISAGLIYPPSQYQSADEIVEIAKVVRDYDGIFDVHMRSEGDRLFESMDEVIGIGKRSGISVMITHFKVRGKGNWGRSEEALEKLDAARNKGVDVSIAQYPYTAGSTMLQAVIPPWYHTKGPDHLIAALKDRRHAVKDDIRNRTDWENFHYYVGWENIYISSVEKQANKPYEGKNIVEIAEMRGLDDPADAALDLLVDEELAVGMIVFGLHEDDVVRIMQYPGVNFITDGLLGGSKPHPRVYGTFPRILGRYVRENNVLRVEDAVRKMTSLPAEKLRLKTKGQIREGFDADITIFDPETVIDRATYENPRQFSPGIDRVIVNGRIVVENGKQTDAAPGKTVRGR
jgi:N-acyl-D-amino-acid deacylase